jgi:capsid protein
LLEAAETFRKYRTYMIDDFCQPVYSLFLAEAVATGRIKANGFFSDPMRRKAWCAANWNSTATVPVLDPVKEVTAAKMRCEEGFSTREQETAALNGGDFKSNVTQLERENAMIAKANAAKNAGGNAPPVAPPPTENNTDETEEVSQDNGTEQT